MKLEILEYINDNMEDILSEYQDKVNKVFDKYMQLYFIAYAHQKSPEVAREFLNGNYYNFSRELTTIALDTVRKNHFDIKISAKIMDQNGLNIVELYDQILDISKEQKASAPAELS